MCLVKIVTSWMLTPSQYFWDSKGKYLRSACRQRPMRCSFGSRTEKSLV